MERSRQEARVLDAELWRRAKVVFQAVLERPEGEREPLMVQACGTDMELRRAVDSLLEHDAQNPAEDLSACVLESSPAAVPSPLPPGTIGRYRVTGHLGRGGMGVVYRAEQPIAGVIRDVAIKVMNDPSAGRELLRRFEREHEILAQLEHPGIARLIEVGRTDTGQPYAALERVSGMAIDRHCELRHLPLRGRIELMLDVCDAVQFAHRNLVVHRDLKPSNIMVTDDGKPKLLDFGIATWLDVSETTTGAAGQPGPHTPAYASPEQRRGLPVTTSSDVYSLGVVLHELLVGARPQPSAAADQPPRPASDAVVIGGQDAEHLASLRGTTPSKLRRALRGDLDNIVAKALAPVPDERYASPAALADDLRRYLSGHRVLATHAGLVYRLRKFARRRPALVALTASAVLLLTVVGVGAGLAAKRVERERDSARAESAIAESALSFLVETLDSALPAAGSAYADEVVPLLDRNVARIDSELGDQPRLQRRVRFALARMFLQLGRNQKAVAMFEQVLADDQTPALLRADVHTELANAALAQGDGARAEGHLRPALAAYERLPDASRLQHANALYGLCRALTYDKKQPGRAVAVCEQAVAEFRALPEAAERVPNAMLRLSEALEADSQHVRAHEVETGALALYRQDLPGDHDKLAILHLLARRTVEAKAKYERIDELLELAERRYGVNSARYVNYLSMTSKELVFTKEIDRGIAGLERALEIFTAQGVPENGWTRLLAKTILAEAWSRLGRHQDARRAMDEVVAASASQPEHNRLTLLASRPIVLLNAGATVEAEASMRDVITRRTALLGNSYQSLGRDQSTLALILARQGRCEEVQPLAKAGLRDREADPLFFGWRAQQALLECQWAGGQLEEFAQLLTASKALALPRQSFEILRYIEAMEPRLSAARRR